MSDNARPLACVCGANPVEHNDRFICGTRFRVSMDGKTVQWWRSDACWQRRLDFANERVARLYAALEECDEAFSKFCPDPDSRYGQAWASARHALRKVDPFESKAKPCPYCLKASDDCDCSDLDVNPEGGAR